MINQLQQGEWHLVNTMNLYHSFEMCNTKTPTSQKLAQLMLKMDQEMVNEVMPVVGFTVYDIYQFFDIWNDPP